MVLFVTTWLIFLVMVISHTYIVTLISMSHDHTSSATSREFTDDRRKLGKDNSIPGFLSIDCGLPKDDPGYTDPETRIVYTSDAEYIDTGESMYISSMYLNSDSNPSWKLLETVRCFPLGTKNCYTLMPEQGRNNTYLVRATFMYGNYDNKDDESERMPEFDLYLGPNLWTSLIFDNVTHLVIEEIIHVPPRDFIDVCLVYTGKGVPFISAVELRLLNNTIYGSQSGSLETWTRWDHAGNTENPPIRYPDDDYDRIWYPQFTSSDYTQIKSPPISDTFIDNIDGYKPPPTVMRTAVKPSSPDGSIYITWTPPHRDNEYYVYMYFAETQPNSGSGGGGDLREFIVYKNDVPIYGPVSLHYLSAFVVPASLGGTPVVFKITATNRSTLPPLINAAEFYKVRELPQSPTDQDDVEAIITIKKIYSIKKIWQGDPCLPKNSWDGLNCNYEGNESPRITSLILASSELEGGIDPALSRLTYLQHLDLSNNSLNGTIPEFISKMSSLTSLILSGNKLTGPVPQVLIEKANNGTLTLSVDENLCWSLPCKKAMIKKDKNKFIVPVAITTSVSLVLLVVIAVFFKYKRKRHGDLVVDASKEGSLKSKNQKFSYSEINSITNNFERVIGRGGSGTVYHGCLRDESQVAIKILSPSSTHIKEFHTEVQLLMRIHHRNLVSLVGYCDEGSNMALIYEYMANGNLQQHLSEGTPNVLSWKERLCIAVDAAQGLEYLHNGCKPPIIHRDMKGANILLNEKLQAKIADFGVSRIFATESVTHVSTRVAGTHGYIDPEYYATYKLNEKSDVFSFGIVIFELITGQPAIIKDTKNIHIVKWVKSILAKGDIQKIVDPRLQGKFSVNSAWKALETAMACVPLTAIQRPSMSDVLMELKDCLAIDHAADERRMESNETGSSHLSLGTELAPHAR